MALPLPPGVNRQKTAGTKVRELVLNLGLEECLVRGLTAILLPMILLLIDYRLLFFVGPFMVYCMITALIHYCPIKHAWHRWIQRRSDENMNHFWDREN
jgi:hypothetical protein